MYHEYLRLDKYYVKIEIISGEELMYDVVSVAIYHNFTAGLVLPKTWNIKEMDGFVVILFWMAVVFVLQCHKYQMVFKNGQRFEVELSTSFENKDTFSFFG